MSENRRPGSGIGTVRRGTRVIRRKLDCLKPNLQSVQYARPSEMMPDDRRRTSIRSRAMAGSPFGCGAMSSEDIQGDEWAAYLTLETYDEDERGIAYRTRVPGRRSSRSSRGIHAPPGRTGKPSTGRRGTGDRTFTIGRYAKCRTPKRYWVSYVTGEPDAGKLARPVCAVWRFVVSPAQPGGTRKEVLGSPD